MIPLSWLISMWYRPGEINLTLSSDLELASKIVLPSLSIIQKWKNLVTSKSILFFFRIE